MQLQYYPHHTHHASHHMACDHILLHDTSACLSLRSYQWRSPAYTFGYLQTYATIVDILGPEAPQAIRRISAGGFVNHQNDLTTSLCIPKTHPWFALSAHSSYQHIHQVWQQSLQEHGIDTRMHSCPPPDSCAAKPGQQCFTSPVSFDLIDTTSNRKRVGSAQKRSRDKLLIQSTLDIANISLPIEAFLHTLRLCLQNSLQVTIQTPSIPLEQHPQYTQHLQHYQSPSWNQKR